MNFVIWWRAKRWDAALILIDSLLISYLYPINDGYFKLVVYYSRTSLQHFYVTTVSFYLHINILITEIYFHRNYNIIRKEKNPQNISEKKSAKIFHPQVQSRTDWMTKNLSYPGPVSNRLDDPKGKFRKNLSSPGPVSNRLDDQKSFIPRSNLEPIG
jgi:hypothetical protein